MHAFFRENFAYLENEPSIKTLLLLEVWFKYLNIFEIKYVIDIYWMFNKYSSYISRVVSLFMLLQVNVALSWSFDHIVKIFKRDNVNYTGILKERDLGLHVHINL